MMLRCLVSVVVSNNQAFPLFPAHMGAFTLSLKAICIKHICIQEIFSAIYSFDGYTPIPVFYPVLITFTPVSENIELCILLAQTIGIPALDHHAGDEGVLPKVDLQVLLQSVVKINDITRTPGTSTNLCIESRLVECCHISVLSHTFASNLNTIHGQIYFA